MTKQAEPSSTTSDGNAHAKPTYTSAPKYPVTHLKLNRSSFQTKISLEQSALATDPICFHISFTQNTSRQNTSMKVEKKKNERTWNTKVEKRRKTVCKLHSSRQDKKVLLVTRANERQEYSPTTQWTLWTHTLTVRDTAWNKQAIKSLGPISKNVLNTKLFYLSKFYLKLSFNVMTWLPTCS